MEHILEATKRWGYLIAYGKAAIKLTKKECAEYLSEALQLLTGAYQSAGLLWAARASCIFLVASLIVESEDDSQLPISFVPTMGILARITLELRHIPDFLFAIQMLNGSSSILPLTDDSKKFISEEIMRMDMVFASILLSLDEQELQKVTNLPDILEGLGLFTARSALLYILGYSNIIRKDGSFPDNETDDELNQFYSKLASQQWNLGEHRSLVLNVDEQQTLSTSFLGMTVECNISGSTKSIVIAEAILGILEVFFATAIEQGVSPHTEQFSFQILESSSISEPSFDVDTMDMEGTIHWPTALSPNSFENQKVVHKFWTEVSGGFLATCCVLKETKGFLEKLFEDDAVHHRMSMVMLATNSYRRIADREVSHIENWSEGIKQSYPLKDVRPVLENIPSAEIEGSLTGKKNKPPAISEDHRTYSVKAVIDLHTWNQAKWRGIAYASHPYHPPYMAFMFEDEEAGKKIFERWRERFGKKDINEEISLSVIRELPNLNEHYYYAQITPKLPRNEEKNISFASRSLLMEPDNSNNLNQFLELYRSTSSFYIVPAILSSSMNVELVYDLAILKRDIRVSKASELSENDVENIAVKAHEERLNKKNFA